MTCAQECETFLWVRDVSYCAPLDYDTQDAGWSLATCTGKEHCVGGRRPPGFVGTRIEHFERMAELEAASVYAFEILAEELHAFGAPSSLVQAALRSARDEVRHARMMGRLAGITPRVAIPPRRVRSLVEVAVENAREGCVRETFGAAVARLESVTASTARVRKVMKRIFPDEERHAELAFAVDAWARSKLSQTERQLVADAKRTALDDLRAELASSPALLALVEAMPVAA
jgi:hypothetical protein